MAPGGENQSRSLAGGVSSGGMQIQRVDPADADVVRACHAVHVAARAVDDPGGDPPFSLALFSAHLAHGWSCDPTEVWCVPRDLPGDAGQGGGVAAYCPSTRLRKRSSPLGNIDTAVCAVSSKPMARSTPF